MCIIGRKLSKRKYQQNEHHRQNLKARSMKQYGSPQHKKRVIAENKLRMQKKENSEHFDFVAKQFMNKVKDGPELYK